MAKRDRLPEIEAEYGEPLTELIPRLLNAHGKPGAVEAVADGLDVHPNTIKRWMKKARIQRTEVVRFTLPEAEHAAS